MIAQSVTIDDAIDVLNRALQKDRETMSQLFLDGKFYCNDDLADDPTIQCGSRDGRATVGPLGIINGFFGVDDSNYGAISMQVDLDSGAIVKFYRTDQVQKQSRGNSLHKSSNEPARLMSTSEVAARFRVSRRTVIRAIQKGDLPVYRVGRRYRISEQAINEWISSAG